MNVEVLTSIGTELGPGSLHIAGAARSSLEDEEIQRSRSNSIEWLAAGAANS